jgi:hypothetical protein
VVVNDSLVSAHSLLSELIGSDIESVPVFERAEEHRAHWRPTKTRVVLLAESHVYTSAAELQRSLRSLPGLPADIPRGFVRLVYCLGYGENDWLDQPVLSPRNSGTPQYWKIFYSCLNPTTGNADFASVQRSLTPSEERLRNKVGVLTELRDRGIWLVDASVAALYRSQGQASPPRLREAVIQTSWDSYTGSVVEAAQPEAILCIGVGVARSLRTRLNRLGIPWGAIHQPQAHLSAAAHARIFAIYHSVCEDPRRIGIVPAVI